VIEALTGQGLDVGQACLTLGVSRGGYYAWRGRPTPPKRLRRIWLANEIIEIHKASYGTYGEPRVTAELRFGRGVTVGHNTVYSIMKELGIKGIPNRRPPKGSRMAQVTSLDLVKRNFRRAAPNQLWLTDITEHPTREGKVYCCAVLDAFSRRIVGWSINSTQTSQLVMNALGMATAERHPDGDLVLHSDRGAQLEFKGSSQHLDLGGVYGYGKTARLDEGVDREKPDGLARPAGREARNRTGVLAKHRGGQIKRRGCAPLRHGPGSRLKAVPARWRDANHFADPAIGPLPLV